MFQKESSTHAHLDELLTWDDGLLNDHIRLSGYLMWIVPPLFFSCFVEVLEVKPLNMLNIDGVITDEDAIKSHDLNYYKILFNNDATNTIPSEDFKDAIPSLVTSHNNSFLIVLPTYKEINGIFLAWMLKVLRVWMVLLFFLGLKVKMFKIV